MNSDITQYKDFRNYLRDELSERAHRNPKYSLRAFAKDLDISHSRLSEVLRGRYGLSERASSEIANRLGLSELEVNYFKFMVRVKNARSEKSREQAGVALNSIRRQLRFQPLSMDYFNVVSKWYHFAILDLYTLDDFENTPEWMAKALGLNKMIVEYALERLKSVDLLVEKDGELVPSNIFAKVGNDTPSEAIRRYHRQLLEKAQMSLSEQSVEERLVTALVLPVDSKKIARAKKLINKFKQDFCDEMMEAGTKDEVYCLGLEYFRLTENSKTRGK